MTPLVRVPAIDAALIARVLDGGALGIIAPQVESAADAARVVACCRHPPRAAAPTPADRRRWATATCPRPRPWRPWTPAC
ncbi:aldolase/citrate lyase family protein [Achromobacter xylosoxidans]